MLTQIVYYESMSSMIRQESDPVLRKISQAVPITDLASSWITKLIAEMSKTLAACADGVALAAPQIGESWRVFIVGERAFPLAKEGETRALDRDLVFINPKIVRRSRKKVELTEGCLSVINRFGTVKRHEQVTVEAYNEAGKKFTRHASGLMAQIFQHEIAHLDGHLFIDEAWDVHVIEPDGKHD